MDKDYFDAAYDLWSETGINLINADFFDIIDTEEKTIKFGNKVYGTTE